VTRTATIDSGTVSRPYAWAVFALIFGLLLSDYMSRQVLSAVFPQLKHAWGLSDTQLGTLGGVVALMVGLLTLPLSLLADRWGRVRSLTLMAVLWSLATLACGLSRDYGQMLAARLFVGVGEAAYGSVGVALAISIFPTGMRATITGAFMAGGVFGSVLGMGLGGAIGQGLGWPWSFAVMAILGLMLAAAFRLSVPDSLGAPPAVEGRRSAFPSRQELAVLLGELFGAPTLICAYVGSGLQLFVMSAALLWMPSYLNRYYGLDMAKAGAAAAGLVLIGGVGMIVCGVAADRLSKGRGRRKASLTAGYCLASLVFFALAFALPAGAPQLALIGAAMFFVAGSSGPAGALVADVTRAQVHGAAFAVLTMVNNLLGLAPAQVAAGVISDNSSLLTAFRVIPWLAAAAAAGFWIARRCYDRDVARRASGLAPARETAR
jgi:predicted MFS family arabinose efflux permease